MKTWLVRLAAGLVTLGGLAAEVSLGQATDASHPNIILLMGDDHGWDETGYNGHPHLKTPVLDEMAASGLRLDRFYSAHPSCSPTRGSVMTGRHPVRYGTFAPGWSLRPEEVTIAHLLGNTGYACGHFGKWHLGPVKANSPTNPGAMGFDQWLSHDNFFELNPTFSRNGGPPQKFEGESSEIVIRETIEFLAGARKTKQPFFAVVWFGSPHEPYSGLAKDLALYDDLPSEYSDQQVRLTSNETGRQTMRPLRDVLRERYAEITAMDRSIGQLRQWLKQAQLQDNTLLWYCGDNGTPLDGIVTSPFRGQKGNLYQGGIRVPGIIEWPSRISKPGISEMNAVTSDMLPTLCKLTRTPLPDRPLDGMDLTPMIDGQMSQRPSPIGFWTFDSNTEAKNEPYIEAELQRGTTPLVKLMGDIHTRNFRNFHHSEITEQDFAGSRALVGNRYKLVVQNKRGGEPISELYDLLNDPSETKNLVESKSQVAAGMQVELKDWQQSVLSSLTAADYE
ncbi:sulfatase family protein [Novipirellula artificiosorum]|uniref:Arylsulfatase n=1 Tax=Novipirellula artificiosorum TaxID=2528016 RepID=A0A5C6DFR3_9BACT|nr:sulfatase-like hydrolase/transferase [Novipirellula artificiosorum]TWU36113.1 Arylsulfatase [Novipirellula artificiosorum]